MSAEPLNEIDEMLMWLEAKVHHLDNIKRKDGMWSVKFHIRREDCQWSPHAFAAPTLLEAVNQAVDYVLAYRHERFTRPLAAAGLAPSKETPQ